MSAPPVFPDASGPVTLAGPAGAIEAAVELPKPENLRRGVAVIGHPHPPDGGTMHNKVVTSIARALAECGIASVRFNFRGVGRGGRQHRRPPIATASSSTARAAALTTPC